jgi:SAM-dependent methyltransferase
MGAPVAERPGLAAHIARFATHQVRRVRYVLHLVCWQWPARLASRSARVRRRLVALRAASSRRPGSPAAGTSAFRCNICGAHGCSPDALLRQRETPTCRVCGSTQRFRALMAALQSRLPVDVAPLRLQQPRKELAGLGMSDARLYADWLDAKFAYTNTFFHTAPFLDIQHPGPQYLGRHDFVVTSDVMEHVAPPVADAFVHLHGLLKPGGVLALTVPYAVQGSTVEHFPDLAAFRIETDGTRRRLVNRTRDGREQVFEGLCFHGGEGATLEMRVFALPDLLRLLEASGFTDIRVHDQALPAWGILVDTPCSHPITAIARAVEPASTTAMR